VNARPVLFALEGLPRPEALLAIVGGAALGALLAGWIARLLTRWLTTRPAPRWMLVLVRVLGAVALGLLVAVWVWNGGGWGPFGNGPGPGGLPGGQLGGKAGVGEGGGTGPKADSNNSGGTKPPADSGAKPPADPEKAMKVAVLTDAAVAKEAGEEAVKEHRYYRREDRDAKDAGLYTLKGIEDAVEDRRGRQPPLEELVLVLPFEGGAGSRSKAVIDLKDWAQSKGLSVRVATP
jgi:hypothetical protein